MVCANETAENALTNNAREKLDLIQTTFNLGCGCGIFSNHVTYRLLIQVLVNLTTAYLTGIAAFQKAFLETYLA